MNYFLKKLLEFTLFFISIFLLISISINFSNNLILKNIKLKKNIKHLIIGDSRTQIFDDSILDDCQNIAQGSESLYFSYLKLDKLLKSNQSIKNVYLGVSYHSFSSYFDEYTFNSNVVSNYFFILPYKDKIDFILNDDINIKGLIKNFFIKGVSNIVSKKKSYIGHSYIHSSDRKPTEKSIQLRISKQFTTENSLNYSNLNILYFDKIVKLCYKYDVELFILNTPTHSLHHKKTPKKYINKYLDLTSNIDNHHMIRFENILKDEMFLPDGDHINKFGANIISFKLKTFINNE